MKKIKNLFLLFCLVFAIVFFVSCNCEANNQQQPEAKYKDITPPANVTDLTADCIASGTVKLTWTNPTNKDFAWIVITYGTEGKDVKVVKPNNEETIIGLTNGTEYEFIVKSYDNAGNASSGVNIKYTPGVKGGLLGTPKQVQGAVVKESWMADNGNLKVDGAEIAKTSEVVVVPTGTVAIVTMPEDSSSSYFSETAFTHTGVFLKDRKVKLDPFVMSQFQVTQKLYSEIMGENPSDFSSNPAASEIQDNRPVEKVTWYKACAFCNGLTKKTFGDGTNEYVYYSNSELTIPYTGDDASSDITPYVAYDEANRKWTKTGYRLPTEAEWEFAARGGDPNKAEWGYAYAGVQTKIDPEIFIPSKLADDEQLENYAWYQNNCNTQTHEVGLKEKNTLNLYDMCGNVWEWCYDYLEYTLSSNDESYKVGEYVQNPLGVLPHDYHRCHRGGSYYNFAYISTVSFRGGNPPDFSNKSVGFRVCRSTEVTE